MVFGLFSRKREPQPDTPDAALSQLRTPSPSVDSASIGKQQSPSREPPLTPSPPPEAQKPIDLYALIQSIPPPTLHSYALSHVHPSSTIHSETLAHLSAFFSELVPPPRLHCVRCHKSYFDVENTDRSCLVAHDDESAEVERVSSKAKGKNTLYETLWGCCGRTVEGDGDMGPPDGWCYEGKHTTDPKRARFRADSTMQDDKLTSCARLRCHEPPRSARKTRKRGRPIADDEEEEDEGEQSSASSSHPSISASASPRRRNGKKPRTLPPDESERAQMDVDLPPRPSTPTPAPASPKAKPKSRATKPKPPAPTTAKSLTMPKASSPLVLAPPFVSHSVSPEPPAKARVVVNMKKSSAPAPLKPRSSAASLKPKSSAASLKSKPSAGSTPKSGAMEPPASPPRRSRKDSSSSSKPRARPKGKTKGLVEVVDSSIDAERAGP